MYNQKKDSILNYHNERVIYAIKSFGEFENQIDKIRDDIYQKLKK